MPSAEASELLESVQDPDEVVKLLCSKFSQLIDRVALAEDACETAAQQTEQLRRKLAESSERRQATSGQMQSSFRTQMAEAEASQHRLKEARANQEFVTAELQRAKEVAHGLNEECERLSSQCQEEQRSLEETVTRMQQEEQSTATSERERQRLRAEVEALCQRVETQEEELARDYQRDRQRRADVRQLEMRLQDAGRQRVAAEKRLQSVQEELGSTQKQVAQYKERLEQAQEKLQLGHEELMREAQMLEESRREQRATQQEEVVAREALERLRQLKARAETLWHEKLEAESQLKAAQLKRRCSQELWETVDIRQKEALARLSSLIDSTTAQADLERWQQRLRVLGGSLQELRANLHELEQNNKGASSVGLSLQEELQRVFLATEQLRRDREQVAQSPALLKLRQAEPALEAARRRARELEMRLEDLNGDVAMLRQRKESFLREVRLSREKMRGLRKRHTALTEKGRALEKRLLRSAMVPGLTDVLKSGKAPAVEQVVEDVRRAPVQAPAPETPTPSLDYLRQWVELEEARLRKPPELGPL